MDTPESQLGAESSGAGGSRSSFADRLASAIKHGLPADRALAMLTVNPARLLGLERDLGTIESGKVANLVVADGPLFTDRPDAPKKDEPGYIKPGRIVGVWIDGREHIMRSLPPIPVGGRYELTFDPPPPTKMKVTFDLDDSSSLDRPDLRITKLTPDDAHPDDPAKDKSVEINVTDFSVRNTTFRFSFEHEPFGEKGVFVNSGVIEKAPDGTIILRAEGVRSSGRNFNWTARRTGPATPRKRSLAGSWPLLFDAPGANTPLLVFDQGNIPTIQPAPGLKQAVEGKPLKLDNFTYDGAKFSYDFDQSQMLGQDGKPLEGVARVAATMDWTTSPPRLAGTVTPPGDAAKLNFTSIRRARNPFTGDWRITQADGVAHDLNSPDGLTITVKGGGANSGPGSGGGGRRGRGRAAEGGGDGAASRGPTVTLTFTSKDKPPTVIEASEVEQRGGKLFFQHSLEKLGGHGESRDELTIAWNKDDPNKDILIGLGRTPPPDDSAHAYQAARVIKPDEDKKEAASIAAIPEKLSLPFGPFGVESQPEPERLVITNATIWTCKDGAGGADTIITDGAIVISDGKISYVGPSASLPRLADGFTFIDAKGKYVTPGIIDCHSHTGISRGVNESGQAVTAEVRIGDVTNPDDVSWYRQLAGGVTCVNNLHGSANAIGGQSMVNKIRWGCVRPDDLHFERATALALEGSASTSDAQTRGALPGIKFALGENPKQSNWGDRSVTRYPQTRMGVETLIRDRFTAAREYLDTAALYGAMDRSDQHPEWVHRMFALRTAQARAVESNGQITREVSLPMPSGELPKRLRRDLELEALAEVLTGARLVHCHSYRQDEILMLTRVARDFGFKIGTFQHILEGYKVADEMVKYSGGGSAFSDWWAYKVEVQDAIPAAGPLMAEQGVTVSYNSDSDEMARRLNVEAGKATKYSRNNNGGAIPIHEAFKFVTLNPAKQLHIDKFTGSLEAGKDADIALWSGVPTSPTSRCEMTLVDGRRLFTLELDAQHRDHIKSERARLIQKVLASPDRGGRDGGEGADVAAEFDDEYDSAVTTLQIELSLQQARAVGRRLMLLEAHRAADDYIREQNLDLIRRGLDPRWMRAGDCGCGF